MHVIYNFLIKQSEHPRTHELEMRPYNSASRLYINEGRSDELKMYLEIRPQQFTLCGAGWKIWGILWAGMNANQGSLPSNPRATVNRP